MLSRELGIFGQKVVRGAFEGSRSKAEVSAVDKASLKALPTTYKYAVYIILLFKLDRS